MPHRTTLIELLGGVGLVAGDVFALLSVFGSALLLTTALVNRQRGRQRGRSSEQIWMWSVGGLAFGLLVTVPLLFSNTPVTRVGFIFGLSLPTTMSLLLLSVALLAVRSVVRRPRPSSQQ